MRKQRSTKNGKCQKQVENEAGELQARIPFKRRGIHNYVGLYGITDPGILYIIIFVWGRRRYIFFLIGLR